MQRESEMSDDSRASNSTPQLNSSREKFIWILSFCSSSSCLEKSYSLLVVTQQQEQPVSIFVLDTELFSEDEVGGSDTSLHGLHDRQDKRG